MSNFNIFGFLKAPGGGFRLLPPGFNTGARFANGLTRAGLLVLVGLLVAVVAPRSGLAVAGPSPATFTGLFSVLYGDPEPSSGQPSSVTFVLAADNGNKYVLLFDPRLSDRLQNLRGKRLKVTGTVAAASPQPDQAVIAGNFTVNSVELANDVVGTSVAPDTTGNKRFVSLMCKFSDIAAEPQPQSFFIGQLGASKPGFNHYIQEMSYGAANLDNSSVDGWITLPKTRQQYLDMLFPDYLYALFEDCGNASSGIADFSPYFGVNIMLNGNLGGSAYGGNLSTTLKGKSQNWNATWMPYTSGSRFGWLEHGVLAHEISHAFGSPHSGSSTGYEYGSSWDVVSNPQANCSGTAIDTTYGCLGQGIVSYNRDTMGFIPAYRKAVFNRSLGTQTFTLDNLGQQVPSSSGSKYMVVVPSLSSPSTKYYTVEARKRVGYDSKLPLADAVIIHDVDTTRRNGNSNAPVPWLFVPPGAPADALRGSGTGAAGANWAVAQELVDTTNKVKIRVDAAVTTGFTITVSPIVTSKVVSEQYDTGSVSTANTLSWALSQAAGDTTIETIDFQLLPEANYTVTLQSGDLPPVRAGLIMRGKNNCTDAGPNITLDGNGLPSLKLGAGNITLKGLIIKGFAGPQVSLSPSSPAGPIRFACTQVMP